MKTKANSFILVDDENTFFAKEYAKRGVQVKRIYKKIPTVLKFLRRVHMYSKLPGYSIWFGEWKKELPSYDSAIIFASVIKLPAARFIRKHYPGIRVIFWYWNPAKACVNPDLITDEKIEKWSFDPKDCIKYNMRYNTQFYFNNISVQEDGCKTEDIDILFIGADKNRLKKLLEIKVNMDTLGLKTYFHITADNRWGTHTNKQYRERISYETILQYISRSKAILDITAEGQEGLTLRPLEALFYKKKLITNNRSIIDCDFYHPNNIFLLNADNAAQICDFLKLPMHEADDGLLEKYDFKAWKDRFFKEIDI